MVPNVFVQQTRRGTFMTQQETSCNKNEGRFHACMRASLPLPINGKWIHFLNVLTKKVTENQLGEGSINIYMAPGRLHGSSIRSPSSPVFKDAASTSRCARCNGRSNIIDPSLQTITFPSLPDPSNLQVFVTSEGVKVCDC